MINMSALDTLKNIVDNNIGDYLGMPPIIDRPKSKCRLGTTTKKRNKDKELKIKKIAEKSRKRNRKGKWIIWKNTMFYRTRNTIYIKKFIGVNYGIKL